MPAKRYRFIYLLNVAQRRVQAAVSVDGDGNTAARAGLLMAIAENGIAMSDLARMLDLGAPALSGLIDRSARAGLVERVQDPIDRRARIIALTPAGLTARAHAVEGARTLNARLCDGFTQDELETVSRWLHAVKDRFPKEKET